MPVFSIYCSGVSTHIFYLQVHQFKNTQILQIKAPFKILLKEKIPKVSTVKVLIIQKSGFWSMIIVLFYTDDLLGLQDKSETLSRDVG